jgi:hypothetical protein
MLVVTRPALRPITAATAAVMAGAVGAVPATAAGAPHAPATTAHWCAPHDQPAILPAKAMPAVVNAATARDPGGPPTGLAARNVVVAGDGVEAAPRGDHGTTAHAAGAPARARAPPR